MKTITMTMRDERGDVTIREEFDEDCSSLAISYTFTKFLRAMGYMTCINDDQVEEYVAAAPEGEKLW